MEAQRSAFYKAVTEQKTMWEKKRQYTSFNPGGLLTLTTTDGVVHKNHRHLFLEVPERGESKVHTGLRPDEASSSQTSHCYHHRGSIKGASWGV